MVGVVIGVRDGQADGLGCGAEEVYDVVYPDVEGRGGGKGGESVSGEGGGVEGDARRGGYVWGKGLLVGYTV